MLQRHRDDLMDAIRNARETCRWGVDLNTRLSERNFHYLGNVSKPIEYGARVEKLRADVRENMREQGSHPITLMEWWRLYDIVIQALNRESFDISFETLVKMHMAEQREQFWAECADRVSAAWQQAFGKAKETVLKTTQPLPHADMERGMKGDPDLLEATTAAVDDLEKFLDTTAHRDAGSLIMPHFRQFLDDQEQYHVRQLQVLYKGITEVAKTQQNIMRRFREEAQMLRGTEDADQRNRAFDTLFRQLVDTELRKAPVVSVRKLVEEEWDRHQALRAPKSLLRRVKPGFHSTDVFVREHVLPLEADLVSEAKQCVSYTESKVIRKLIAAAQQWRKERSGTLRFVLFIREKLTAILEERQRDWESRKNLAMMLQARRECFMEEFYIICKGYRGQLLLARRMTQYILDRMLWIRPFLSREKLLPEIVRTAEHVRRYKEMHPGAEVTVSKLVEFLRRNTSFPATVIDHLRAVQRIEDAELFCDDLAAEMETWWKCM
eukprot:Sspe_Gene.60110::Locus_33089_Transcript_1_1_Confidence_1.000_Length_2775::g.60110::m.60110